MSKKEKAFEAQVGEFLKQAFLDAVANADALTDSIDHTYHPNHTDRDQQFAQRQANAIAAAAAWIDFRKLQR